MGAIERKRQGTNSCHGKGRLSVQPYGMHLQSDSRGLALEGAMALYNLQHFELVNNVAMSHLLYCS